MAKDPAALFYISNWLTSTAEFKAEERGWYLNLILHQYDKGDLPSEIEELANLAGVRISEFEKFTTSWQQVLQHKFNKCCNTGRLKNAVAAEIIQKREVFKDKRSDAGKISSVVKKAMLLSDDEGFIKYVKENFDIDKIGETQHLLQQMLQLYINENIDINKNVSISGKGGVGEKPKKRLTQKTVNEQTLTMRMEEDWNKFLLQHHEQSYYAGPAPRKALASIKAKLLFQANEKLRIQNKTSDQTDDQKIIESWRYILQNYALWEDFDKKWTELTQINARLSYIISSIKTPKTNAKPHQHQSQGSSTGRVEPPPPGTPAGRF